MKISNSIFTIIIIVLIATSVSTLYGIESSSQKITAEITEKIEVLSQNTMNEISKLMFERQADIRQLSDIRNPILHNPNISLESKIDYLRTLEKSSKAFTSISLYDENGIKIGNTRNVGIGSDDSDKPFFISAIKNQYYVDDIPVYSSVLNLNIIHFSGPLYDEHGVPNGIVMAEFPLNKITNLINQNEDLISETNFDLVSNDGTVIFSKDIRESAFSRSINSNDAFDIIKNSQDNVISGIDNKQDVLFVIVSQSNYLDYMANDWYLFVSIPSGIALQEVNDFRTSSLIVTAIAIATGFIVSSLFSRSITTPIISLQKSFRKVVSGDFPIVSVPKGDGEIHELYESFNLMTESLKKTIELEKKLAITENKLKTERFAAIEELSARMAHDMRNPLSVIKTTLDSLRKLKDRPDDFDKSMKRANRAIDRIAHQIDGVMDFVKDSKLELELISITKFVSELVSEMTISDAIKIILPTNDIQIHADKDKFETLFSNLIINAIQAMDDKGTLTIQTIKKSNNLVEINVGNDGPQIPEENLEKIFEPLFTTKQKGTGLGLASCKKIIEQHNGSISITNNPVTFRIVLPVDLKK